MEEITMTYDTALKVLESCNDETMKEAAKTACKTLKAEIGRSRRYATDLEFAEETMKEAAKIACKALKAEIGRSRRYATDLEFAEIDYVRDIAHDQGLWGENADDFFWKAHADGFDLMKAFHDGAEWQREREHDGMKLEDFCHVKYMLEEILGRNMERSQVTKITDELHKWAFNVGLFKSERIIRRTGSGVVTTFEPKPRKRRANPKTQFELKTISRKDLIKEAYEWCKQNLPLKDESGIIFQVDELFIITSSQSVIDKVNNHFGSNFGFGLKGETTFFLM